MSTISSLFLISSGLGLISTFEKTRAVNRWHRFLSISKSNFFPVGTGSAFKLLNVYVSKGLNLSFAFFPNCGSIACASWAMPKTLAISIRFDVISISNT